MSGGALHVADQPHEQGVQVGGGREDPVDRFGGVQPLLAAQGAGGDQRTVAQQVRTGVVGRIAARGRFITSPEMS